MAGIWELEFQEALTTLTDKSGSSALCKQYGLCRTPCFPSGRVEFGYTLGRGSLWNQAPIKPLSIVSHELLWEATFGRCCYLSLQRGLSVFCDSTGRGVTEGWAWLPPDFTLCSFLCCFCSVLYSFAVTNLSLKDDCVLSP